MAECDEETFPDESSTKFTGSRIAENIPHVLHSSRWESICTKIVIRVFYIDHFKFSCFFLFRIDYEIPNHNVVNNINDEFITLQQIGLLSVHLKVTFSIANKSCWWENVQILKHRTDNT